MAVAEADLPITLCGGTVAEVSTWLLKALGTAIAMPDDNSGTTRPYALWHPAAVPLM